MSQHLQRTDTTARASAKAAAVAPREAIVAEGGEGIFNRQAGLRLPSLAYQREKGGQPRYTATRRKLTVKVNRRSIKIECLRCVYLAKPENRKQSSAAAYATCSHPYPWRDSIRRSPPKWRAYSLLTGRPIPMPQRGSITGWYEAWCACALSYASGGAVGKRGRGYTSFVDLPL